MAILIRKPTLTRQRIGAAFAVAIFTDVAQMLLGPLGWVGLDQALDVFAMAVTVGLLGFHPLLLPSFLLELLPVVDVLPTWTACAALVVAHRRAQVAPKDAAPAFGSGPVIDV
jgi:hypothetical protein